MSTAIFITNKKTPFLTIPSGQFKLTINRGYYAAFEFHSVFVLLVTV